MMYEQTSFDFVSPVSRDLSHMYLGVLSSKKVMMMVFLVGLSALSMIYLYHINSNLQSEVSSLRSQINKAQEWEKALLIEQSTLTGHWHVENFVKAHNFKMPK